jgi:hypothetical protein
MTYYAVASLTLTLWAASFACIARLATAHASPRYGLTRAEKIALLLMLVMGLVACPWCSRTLDRCANDGDPLGVPAAAEVDLRLCDDRVSCCPRAHEHERERRTLVESRAASETSLGNARTDRYAAVSAQRANLVHSLSLLCRLGIANSWSLGTFRPRGQV